MKYGVTNREPEPKWTLYSWLDFWRRTFKTPYNKTDMYQYHIKNHVKARFKDKPLKDVTTIDLQMIITACPYSRSRVDVYQMLNAAFRVAKQQDVISKNPAEGLISPRHRKVSGMPLTLAEQKAFFKSIENEECKNDYLFYLFSGVRRSELLTINVASLDYENNLIYVHGTKTENAERAIPFTDILKSIISEMTPDENGYFSPTRQIGTPKISKIQSESLSSGTPEVVYHAFRRKRRRYQSDPTLGRARRLSDDGKYLFQSAGRIFEK